MMLLYTLKHLDVGVGSQTRILLHQVRLQHASLRSVHDTTGVRLSGKLQGKSLDLEGVSVYTRLKASPYPAQCAEERRDVQPSSTPSLGTRDGVPLEGPQEERALAVGNDADTASDCASGKFAESFVLQPTSASATLHYGLGSELAVSVPMASVQLDRCAPRASRLPDNSVASVVGYPRKMRIIQGCLHERAFQLTSQTNTRVSMPTGVWCLYDGVRRVARK